MKVITDHNVEMLLQDVAYLQEELHALKKVISVIPYSDRPLGQDSVFDIIARIGFAQTVYFLPALQKIMQTDEKGGMLVLDYDQAFKAQIYENLPVDKLINDTIAERKKLVSLLEKASSDQRTLTVSDGELDGRSVYELMGEMVTYERNQLKHIAERVLSIDIEQRNQPESHN